jgi:DNA invertase Pin-like site-specific DNA recombinase
MRQIMGAIAQYDRTMIVAKLKAARLRKKQRDGRCEGNRPYGATPAETFVLTRITQLRDAGRTVRDITQALNDQGVPTRGGGPWHLTQVQRILTAAQ